MKLAKALKVKNVLVKEIGKLKEQIVKHNMVMNENVAQFDVKSLFQDLMMKTNELINLKTNISIANKGIYEKIFNIAELRGIIATLQSLNVQKGSVTTDGYNVSVKRTFNPQMDEAYVTEDIKQLEKQIEEAQDFIDAYNATTEI